MVREKGKRRGGADETTVRQHVKGEVEEIMANRVAIELDRIFDSGQFDEERQVILIEGPPRRRQDKPNLSLRPGMGSWKPEHV